MHFSGTIHRQSAFIFLAIFRIVKPARPVGSLVVPLEIPEYHAPADRPVARLRIRIVSIPPGHAICVTILSEPNDSPAQCAAAIVDLHHTLFAGSKPSPQKLPKMRRCILGMQTR